jgi:hypothetical protein
MDWENSSFSPSTKRKEILDVEEKASVKKPMYVCDDTGAASKAKQG